MATTVRYTKSPGVDKPSIKLNELEANEGDYAIITRGGDMEETYQNVKTERKVNSDKIGVSKEKRDKTKIVIVLLGCVVSGLVVAVVFSILVIFSIHQKPVTNGDWTSWADWGACSVTCGIGITTRIRTCSNPRPSTMGQYCEGTSDQVQICGNSSCSVTDGGWTDWENWRACSVTCGTGFTTRIRTCSNPKPSIMGRYCDGTSLQVQSCSNTSCSDGGFGFSVHRPIWNSGDTTMKFNAAAYNDNDVFNITSGEFVCQKEGLYLLISTFLRVYNTTGSIDCNFYKNSKFIGYGPLASSNNASDHPSATSSILHHLKPGDRVYLGSCEGLRYAAGGSSFTGVLINPMH
ncbi:uncharacterized protein LOC128550946 [Mercenaria mercenaria]|uniref:uncharacterized protein LOC128550946 n=1 Tax=Mercenaria mercenaria TaxID=6596 RepID=UPI00234EDF8E|nr:uncharacterized protein LOC128550946 [Mercenaria mercenaria]